ncbi:hypothetical protein ACFQX7_22435 [Luedemannella flava]
MGRIYATVQHRPTYFVGYDSSTPAPAGDDLDVVEVDAPPATR